MGMGGKGKTQDKSQDVGVGLFSTRLHIRGYKHHQQQLRTCMFSNRIPLLVVLYERTVLAIIEEIISPVWLMVNNFNQSAKTQR